MLHTYLYLFLTFCLSLPVVCFNPCILFFLNSLIDLAMTSLRKCPVEGGMKNQIENVTKSDMIEQAKKQKK
ncbi:hypothetical protein BDZ91DRAFT_739387 [Kalaharituber pfeilii]|nr:hypothetical protein BDZ91DRAFT_739387 [Kalaharituber pfeilii]